MSRIARNSVNGRLNRNTFCSGAEVVPVQCKRGLSHCFKVSNQMGKLEAVQYSAALAVTGA